LKNSEQISELRDARGQLRGGIRGNTGGKKGRSGRKSNDFIAECQRLADEVVLAKVGAKLVASDPDDPAWRWSAEYVSKYVKSEAPKQVALTDGDGAPARFTFVIDSPLGDSDN